MNKKRLNTLLSVLILSLVGIMMIQLIGIRDAYYLQKEQHNNRMLIHLKSVANRIHEIQVDPNGSNEKICETRENYWGQEILHLLKSPGFQTIVEEEFDELRLGIDYEYGIYGIPDSNMYFSSNAELNEKILGSPHVVSFSCFYNQSGFNLAVYIPYQRSMVLANVLPWASALFILLMILVFAFIKIIQMFQNQKELSDMKTDFVNNITHEFKTPIASLSLAADMLLKPEINKEPCQVQLYAKVIKDENHRLKSRVEQVLQLSMLEKGDFIMKKTHADIHKIIEEGLKPHRLLIKEQQVRIIKNFNASASQLLCDSYHLENVISNLVDNSIKYSIGPPEIRLETNSNSHGINILVQDKGIGIRKEDQQNIFRRFYRVSTGNIHDSKGFGLGLHYVKTVVESHGGHISVKSAPGKGSSFEIFLPFQN